MHQETDKLYAWPEMAYMIYSIYENKFKNLITWEIDEIKDEFMKLKQKFMNKKIALITGGSRIGRKSAYTSRKI